MNYHLTGETKYAGSYLSRRVRGLMSLTFRACTVLALTIGVVVAGSIRQHDSEAAVNSAQLQASVVGSVTFSNSGNSGSSNQVENPASGWLYVLDSNNMRSESQVLLVDPDKGSVIHSFRAANAPDMALSPDGSRLYISSTEWSSDGNSGQGKLEVIDTASGAVLQTVINRDRWISIGRQYISHMTVSSNGRWLYIFKSYQTLDEHYNYVEIFDTLRGKFLTEKAMLQGCITAMLLPSPDNRMLNAVCAGTSDVRFIRVTKSGALTSPKKGRTGAVAKISLRSQPETETGKYIGQSILSADGRTLTVIMGDGRFFKIDGETRNIMLTGAIDSEVRKPRNESKNTTSSTAEDWLAGRWIKFQAPSISPDRARMYIGISQLMHLRQGVQFFDQIAVLDSQTLNRIGMIKPSQSFYSFTTSNDGRHLYAISPEQASIMVIDTATQRQIRTIYGIGTSPIRAIVAP